MPGSEDVTSRDILRLLQPCVLQTHSLRATMGTYEIYRVYISHVPEIYHFSDAVGLRIRNSNNFSDVVGLGVKNGGAVIGSRLNSDASSEVFLLL